jgi:hypothetical protein
MNSLKGCLVALVILPLMTACSGDNAEKAASGAVSKTVELVKGAATGASKGLDEGRKATTSADGALIISNGKELSAALTGEVLQAKWSDVIDVKLGFSNEGVVPVRVTELSVSNHVTALDEDGFACTTQSTAAEFTVPAKAKLKVDMQFKCDDKLIAKVRVFDVEYAVAKDRISKAK